MLQLSRSIGVGLGMLSLSLALFASQSGPSRAVEIKEHLQRARQFLAEKKLDDAAREFTAVTVLDPANVEARANLGVMEFMHGDCTRASANFRAVLKLNPNLSNAHALLGFCELQQGDSAEGRQSLERAFPKLTDPKLRIQAGLFLVELYRQSGDVARATATISKLQSLDGENVDVQYAAYRLYSDLADQAVTAVSVSGPDSARMRQIVAQRLIETGNLDGAIRAYREALKIDPHLTGAHFELGETLLRHGSTPEDSAGAQKELEAALAENPHDGEAECLLGELALKNSDEKGAVQHFSRALTIQPQNPDGHMGMGKVYASSGQFDKAVVEFDKVIAADPANSSAHYGLSQVYRKLGRSEDAEREVALFRTLRSSQRELGDTFGRLRGGTTDDPDPDKPNAQ